MSKKELSPRELSVLLGVHVSIAGGIWKAFDRAASLGCTTLQLFVKSNTQWRGAPLKEEDVQRFKETQNETGIAPVVAHSSYLINLCAVNRDLLQRSRQSLKDEILRCSMLGIPFLVFHPGAHMGAGEKEGIQRIAESLNEVHRQTAHANVLSVLECTAGQGTSLGYRFEQLRAIMENVEESTRIGICIDTSHIFAAGYDIRTEKGYEHVIREFDEVIGLQYLRVLHLNDSKRACGSRIDRHEHIGKGTIGVPAFRMVMNDERFRNIPKLLETPKGEEMEEDRMNIKTLLSLVRR